MACDNMVISGETDVGGAKARLAEPFLAHISLTGKFYFYILFIYSIFIFYFYILLVSISTWYLLVHGIVLVHVTNMSYTFIVNWYVPLFPRT